MELEGSTDQLTLKILQGVKSIYSKYDWIVGSYARTSEGRDCEPTNKKACSFCLEGAINKTLYELDEPEMRAMSASSVIKHIIRKRLGLAPQVVYIPVHALNDAHLTSKEDVVSIVDEAITIVKSEGIQKYLERIKEEKND